MNDGMTEADLKGLFKQALVEVLEERKDLFYDLFAEVIEDIGLANAIRDSDLTDRVDESNIMALLETDE